MMTITHSIARAAAALALGLLPCAVAAIDLDLPQGARQSAAEVVGDDSYRLPTAPWNGETVPSVTVEGTVTKQVWKVLTPGLTNLQVLRPLRRQLTEAGFEVLFECRDSDCGGFDFRFGTDVLPAPDMHVDLTSYRFLAARKGAEAVSLLISRNRQSSYVQIIQVGAGAAKVTARDTAPRANSGPQGPMGEALEAEGRVVLADLTFVTGSANLGEGPFASLSELAAYLAANPGRQVALVGHTDSVGSLEGNIALSKRRAGAVMDRMIASYGVRPDQMAAEGMGYLAPIAANLTAKGREANRRVEAVLVSVE